jgi:hypothetical protein
MRVSVATGQSPGALWRAPYRRTLYEFYHLEQIERFEDLRTRGRAIQEASLMALAFHDPKRLPQEHRRLLAELAPPISDAQARADAAALIADVARVDRAGAWR